MEFIYVNLYIHNMYIDIYIFFYIRMIIQDYIFILFPVDVQSFL